MDIIGALFGDLIFKAVTVLNNPCKETFDKMNNTQKLLFCKMMIFLNEENLDKSIQVYGINKLLHEDTDLWKLDYIQDSIDEETEEIFMVLIQSRMDHSFKQRILSEEEYNTKRDYYNNYFDNN